MADDVAVGVGKAGGAVALFCILADARFCAWGSAPWRLELTDELCRDCSRYA